MDVAKSRIQSAPRTGATLVAPDMWVLPAMVTILREEGWRALYKGLGLRLLRLGPGGGIMLLAFTEVSRLL
jgi:solute carrier family 25 2-oxodicarboxylate transporter 21